MKSKYHDERGKMKPGNPGGGRPKRQRMGDYYPKIQSIYDKLRNKMCELQNVDDENLSPNVIEFLECWRIAKVEIEMIKDRTMGPNEMKLLATFLASARQSLRDALDAAKKEKAIEKDQGKDGKKPTGMY